MDESQLLPERLKRRRVELGLSQAEVASRAGIEQSQVSKLERGLDVRLSTLTKLLTALDLDMELAPRPRPGTMAGVITLPMFQVEGRITSGEARSRTGSLLDRFGIPDDEEPFHRSRKAAPSKKS